MGPLISVVVPVYNAKRYLPQCVTSVLNQTYQNIELILVDDGSNDGSGEICDKFRQRDPRVKLIRQPNSGVSAARNSGIQAATGKYLTFVDADDWVDRGMLECMINTIAQNGVDACFCSRYYKDESDVRVALPDDFPSPAETDEAIRRHLRYGFLASVCLGLIDREKIRGCFFDTDIHTLEDWEYNFRMLNRIDCLAILREAFYHYRTVQGSASKSGLDEKKLSCLLIPERVAGFVKKKHLPYTSEIQYIPVFLLNHLLVILANSEYRSAECQVLKTKARQILKSALKSAAVPVRQKIYVTMCAVSPRIFCIAYHIKYRGHHHE